MSPTIRIEITVTTRAYRGRGIEAARPKKRTKPIMTGSVELSRVCAGSAEEMEAAVGRMLADIGQVLPSKFVHNLEGE